MLELAELEATEKRFDSAAAMLRQLQDLLSSQPDALPNIAEQCMYRLGVCEFELGHFGPAAELFERFIKDFPKSDLLASSLFYAGEANFRAGRIDRSAKHLTRVVEDDSTDDFAAPAMLRLGECHAVLQKWALSEDLYQRFLERYPDGEQWYQAQFGLGWSRENQKRYDEAVAAYEKVTARHQGPTAARAQFQIGQCLFAQKKFEPAIRELLKVDILYAYPEWSAAALYEAGRCFSQLNDPVQAQKQFTVVVEKFKDTKWAEMASKQLAELTSSAALPGK
jgi:TolA-binding protein